MIKRLITWFYERYCKEPEYVPTKEEHEKFMARYYYARELSRPFQYAAWLGRAKPDYPQYKGGECPQALKDLLDGVYESNKPKEGTVWGNFADMPVNCERMPLKPTRIYETSQEAH